MRGLTGSHLHQPTRADVVGEPWRWIEPGEQLRPADVLQPTVPVRDNLTQHGDILGKAVRSKVDEDPLRDPGAVAEVSREPPVADQLVVAGGSHFLRRHSEDVGSATGVSIDLAPTLSSEDLVGAAGLRLSKNQ